MNDMSPVIVPKSDQISADDFLSGPRTYIIESVEIRPGTEQPVSVFLSGEDRVWKPCKSMSRCLVAAWGPDAKAYIGRSVTLYRDPKVKWGGMEVGGIRISHLSHIERDMVMALTATKGKRAPYTVKPLANPAPSQQQKEDPAAKWADGYIAKIETIDTIEELIAFESEKAVRLIELKEKRPELHERVTKAAQSRGMALAKEGKPEADAGESFTSDDGEGW